MIISCAKKIIIICVTAFYVHYNAFATFQVIPHILRITAGEDTRVKIVNDDSERKFNVVVSKATAANEINIHPAKFTLNANQEIFLRIDTDKHISREVVHAIYISSKKISDSESEKPCIFKIPVHIERSNDQHHDDYMQENETAYHPDFTQMTAVVPVHARVIHYDKASKFFETDDLIEDMDQTTDESSVCVGDQ